MKFPSSNQLAMRGAIFHSQKYFHIGIGKESKQLMGDTKRKHKPRDFQFVNLGLVQLRDLPGIPNHHLQKLFLGPPPS